MCLHTANLSTNKLIRNDRMLLSIIAFFRMPNEFRIYYKVMNFNQITVKHYYAFMKNMLTNTM